MLYVFCLLFPIGITSVSQPICGNQTASEYDKGGASLLYLGIRIFRNPNPRSGANLAEWNETWEVNPEELGEYAEGDIAFPRSMIRNGLILEAARWYNGIVPYEISGCFTVEELGIIARVMAMYHEKTCIKFRHRREADPDWIIITNDGVGCWSSVGRKGGHQVVNLQTPSCLKRIGTVIHEFMHVIGFVHEHSSWDRDQHVEIEWENVKEGKELNFIKSGRNKVTRFGVAYDYDSVMHYSRFAFSNNRKPTIKPKVLNANIGQRKGFSQKDLKKIELMYNCPSKSVPNDSTTSSKEQVAISTFVYTLLAVRLSLS